MKNMKNKISRRDVFKATGGVSLTVGTGMVGCDQSKKNKMISPRGTATGPIPTNRMEYRVIPKTGEKVSLWFLAVCADLFWKKCRTGGLNKTDQEAANRMIATAMEHGVNYYNASPVYRRGHSEEATGIALSPYPRGNIILRRK